MKIGVRQVFVAPADMRMSSDSAAALDQWTTRLGFVALAPLAVPH
jgi:hypothetical protein